MPTKDATLSQRICVIVWRRMYEDKFGTEEDPIMVPSLENERIIGVTDPEDETLVVWGILKADEGPRQFIEGGEFYVLKVVEYIQKVRMITCITASFCCISMLAS